MGIEIKLLPSRVEKIRLDLIDRDPKQPRQIFSEESLKKLAANIKASGYLIYAILVKPNPKMPGRYIIIAGERRFRALKLIGVEEFYFHIADGEVPSYLISLIENGNREDLNPIDQAQAYQECMDREKMSVAQIAEFDGKHVGDIYRALRLLKLAPEVKQLVREGKLKTGGAHNLVQFKGFSKQIELARKLVAGEDPPEIEERMAQNNERSETAILSRLPKESDGLIRRLLKFRRSNTGLPFVIRAFLDLPEIKQIEGWQYFTKATRENFTTQLRALIFNLQLLEKKMAELPKTKKNPFGPAASKAKPVAIKEKVAAEKKEVATPAKDTFFEEYLMRTHSPEKTKPPQGRPEIREAPHAAAGKSIPEIKAADAKTPKPEPILEVPKLDPAPVRVPVFLNKTAVSAAPRPALPQKRPGWNPKPDEEARFKPKGIPTAAELEAASKVILFLYEEITEGRRKLLSKKTLSAVLSNGKLPENAEALAIKALRTIRDYWRVPPDPMHPETQKFIVLVSQKRHDLERLGCVRFDDLMTVVKNRDNSSDPVNVQRL